MLAVACYFDYRQDRIPNRFILFGFFVAAVTRLLQGILLLPDATEGAVSAFLWETGKILFRMGAVFFIFFLPYLLGMLGAGDVKLFTLSAAFLGGSDIYAFLAGSLLFAALTAVVKMFGQSNLKERLYYFASYLSDVIRCGKLKLYLNEGQDKRRVSLHMAGPMAAGLFCHICGFY